MRVSFIMGFRLFVLRLDHTAADAVVGHETSNQAMVENCVSDKIQ